MPTSRAATRPAALTRPRWMDCRSHFPRARRSRLVAASSLALTAPNGVFVCQESVVEDKIEMPQVDRCSRCNYGPVRGYGTLCRGCEEFLAWEAAEQRRQEKAERRRDKLQQTG
jgi:hypothetical protein